MSEKTKTPDPAADSEKPDVKELAGKYLDFWQQNLTIWATDPKALEKWVETLSAAQAKPSDKKD
ncbi:hypothetical protein [Emcibacter sp.]|uniref:hypothetical protein n=1 Tax=Emcibacter sp. TaxID=1979954 RepID=UPI002AA652C0|nr:hypothetical protein [Emcibacter sp.]